VRGEQGSEIGGQRADVGGRRAEGRGQRTEDRGQRFATANPSVGGSEGGGQRTAAFTDYGEPGSAGAASPVIGDS